MDIHFSDEEDYNSGAEEDWDEYDYTSTEMIGSKESKSDNIGLDRKKLNRKEINDDDVENVDDIEEEADEIEEEIENVDDIEEVEEVEDIEDEEDIDEDAENADVAEEEYYPEEDAGDKEEIVIKEENRITSDVLSKYEIVELISIRATQISKGDHPFVDVVGLRDPISMAKKELYDNRCPLLVKRHIGNNMYEYWNPNNMSKPKI
jgi:DNA-directed RNA polymerase subunit K/omega